MSLVRGADIVVKADLGVQPFMLDRDHLDANPGSELTAPDSALDAVTCDTLSIQWSWGAGDPLGPFTEAEGGRIGISLHDATRDFDPSNTASPYYPYLHVGTRLRVDVDGSPGWTGTLEAWEWDTGDQVATLLGIDAIATLAALVVPDGTVIPTGTTAAQAGAVLDALAWPATLRTFTGTSAVTRSDVTVSGQAMEALHAIRLAELGQMWGTRAGAIAFRARGTTASSTPTTIVNCGGVGLVGLASTFNRGRVRNVVRIEGGSYADYVATAAASATVHGPRTARVGLDELAFPPDVNMTTQEAAWAQTILDALAQPRPASRLGTLVPVGAIQVDVILRAEWGDVWRLVDTGTSPGIDRTVRVLGERVSITPTTIEVDAVTEDLTGDVLPAVPGAPVLNIATPGNALVNLFWTAPAGAVIDYIVTVTPGGATYTTTGTSYTVTGLTNGTLYTFTVKARNAIGTGPASNALTATPVAPLPNYRATVMATSGLVAYWRLGETSGVIAVNEMGTPSATYSNGPTLGVAGATGDGNSAVTLNGTSQYIATPGGQFSDVAQPRLTSVLDTGDNVTLEAFVNRNGASPGANRGILSKGGGSWYMRMDGTTGQLSFLKSQVANIVASTANVPTTGWHHVVATKAGATVKLYLDGADVTGTVSNATLVDNDNQVVIGGDSFGSGASEMFAGGIDEAAVYNRALSASEVLDHYNAAGRP